MREKESIKRGKCRYKRVQREQKKEIIIINGVPGFCVCGMGATTKCLWRMWCWLCVSNVSNINGGAETQYGRGGTIWCLA